METTLREHLSQHMTANGVSQEAAAKTMGISGSALSSWRNNKYTGDNSRMEGLVVAYMNRQDDIQAETTAVKRDFDFVETSVYERIYKGVELADLQGEIRIIVGASGIGKTTALKHIEEIKQNVILIQVYRGMRKNRFLSKLCKAAKITARGSFDDLFDELAQRLNGSGKLIIVDEAEHLPLDAIDALRRLNDFTDCGVVMTGLPEFYERMRAYQRDYAYVYNRTSIPIKLKHIDDSDAGKMVATMINSPITPSVWNTACMGVGRDLKMIVKESMRIAKLNKVSASDAVEFTAVIEKVRKELGRTAV